MDSQIASPKATLPSVTKLLISAFSFYKDHFLVFAGIMAIPFVLGSFQFWGGGADILIGLLSLLFGLLAGGAIITICIEPTKGIAKAYQNALRLLFSYGWISTLTALATLGGFILFIIPGIVLSLWLTFAPYILFAENKRGLDALTASYAYIKGYWWSIVWRIVFPGALYVLIQIALGVFSSGARFQLFELIIIQFVLVPIAIVYAYSIYKAVREIKMHRPTQVDELKFRKTVKLLMALGVIGLIALIFFAGFALVTLIDRFSS